MSYNTPLNVSHITTAAINSSSTLAISPDDYTYIERGLGLSFATLGGDATLDSQHCILCATGLVAPITVTLPAVSAVPDGFIYIIKDADGTAVTNTITIEGNGAETIDGAPMIIMSSAYESITLTNNGTQWSII